EELHVLALATNNGSLYVLTNEIGLFAFASEEYFLKELAKTMHLTTNGNYWIRQVVPGKGFILDLERFLLQEFSFSTRARIPSMRSQRNVPYQIAVKYLSNVIAQ